ncbi:CFEM domain-containing protein [Colletotrichum graminicola M1.001]|uniref:CFEM domain-containing protein n=1 Tax=Colletotrichum graminicola (strain M1.001 / M2 / FGSC 10212) TaxID=645133 RepID=E3QK82_COLGM|nr:CFEM domain-containing protein [Colletotrichum graminicola M1.001]EFQ31270.1 CFEM domain-containing protein [Colletotrichum graminicola M1.001]
MVAVRFFALLASLFMLGSIVSALDPMMSMGFPPCEIECIRQELHNTHCPTTDIACLCNDKAFSRYVQSCVVTNCTAIDMLVAKNHTDAVCGVPMVQRESPIACIQVALFIFTTLVIVTRIAHKCMKISPWGWDDTTVMVAFAVLTPIAYIADAAESGRDVWYLSPDEITEGLKTFFIVTFLYILGLAFVKASVLFLYLRVFPDQRFRRVLWLTQAFNPMLLLSFLTASLASCRPLNYAWDGWTGKTEGRCTSSNPPALAHGALNFILDIWMLLLPVLQIYRLNIPRKQKLDVMSMFSAGIFLTAASGYRIKVIRPFGASFDPEVAFQTVIWSAIELAVGIFVACLPNIRQFWVVVLPKILQATGISSRTHETTRGSTVPGQPPRTTSESRARRSGAVQNDASSTSSLVGVDIHRTKSSQSDSIGATAAPGDGVESTMAAHIWRLEGQLKSGSKGPPEEFDLQETKK